MRGPRTVFRSACQAVLVFLAWAAAAAQPPPEAPRFGDEISVRLVTVVVRVVDGSGEPLLGLTPGDFRVKVGRREVPVTAVDWVATGAEPAAAATEGAAATVSPVAEDVRSAIDADAPSGHPALASAGAPGGAPAAVPGAAPETAATSSPAATPPAAAGKLVVIFVQADGNSPTRTRGHLRTLPFTRELLDALRPEDQVAVLSFDSHLKLWQDFTRERAAIPESIYQAIHYGGNPPATPATLAPLALNTAAGGGAPRLADHFDLAAARDAASPERALAVTAEALAALPGEKVVVFLAWGLGSFSSWGTRMTPAFAPAVRELKAARASVFVLDVTEADSHSMEVGLQGIAEETGGSYGKTNLFPGFAVQQLARTISGYYVLTLDAAAVPAAGGEVEVALHGRRANVLLRPTAVPAGLGSR